MLYALKDKFKNIKFGALSNACGAYARAVVKVNGLDDIFDVSYGADDVPAAKPSPDGILLVIHTYYYILICVCICIYLVMFNIYLFCIIDAIMNELFDV